MIGYTFFRLILQHLGHLFIIVMRLQSYTRPIIIGLVVSKVAYFQGKGLDILAFHVAKCVVVEVAAMFTKENYFIVDSGGAAYGRELGHIFNKTVSIHIPI